jgi:polyisoprenoid-binding protein YceI
VETMRQAPPQLITRPTLRLLEDGALAGEWHLDPRRTSIRLKAKVMSLIPVKGTFHEVSGRGIVTRDGRVSGTVTVAATSVATGITRRDTHLRSADIFDSGKHPHITFTADDIRPSGKGVNVSGALTVRGQARPLSFEAIASMQGDGEIWLDGAARVNRGDFGLLWKPDYRASMTIVLIIHAVFARA